MEGRYQRKSDEELILEIQNGSEAAMDFLMEKYKNMIRRKARTLFLIGGDKDDLIQEGMIGLYKAIRDYQAEKTDGFYHFADVCVSRQMYSAIKASNRKKNMPLNTYVSLDAPAYSGENGEMETATLAEVVSFDQFSNPEQLLIDKENRSVIEYELGRRLSKMEKDVLVLYLSGLKYMQIADRLDRSPKSIDNALQRIKTKLNQVLKDLR